MTMQTDEKLMWKKLSTPYQPIGRVLRGRHNGVVTMIIAGRRCGKTMIQKAYIDTVIDADERK